MPGIVLATGSWRWRGEAMLFRKALLCHWRSRCCRIATGSDVFTRPGCAVVRTMKPTPLAEPSRPSRLPVRGRGSLCGVRGAERALDGRSGAVDGRGAVAGRWRPVGVSVGISTGKRIARRVPSPELATARGWAPKRRLVSRE
mmetsp:Transcript_7111/g.18540  ORF Transcript_7111/g.18540 Transcript_7111/m.18540 type:complete len:143 (+) Transcript_7111:737-1165(+)